MLSVDESISRFKNECRKDAEGHNYQIAILQLHELIAALVLVNRVVVCDDAFAVDGGLGKTCIVSCFKGCLLP